MNRLYRWQIGPLPGPSGIEEGAVLHGQNWCCDTAGDVIEYGQYLSAGERLRSYEYRVEG